MDIVTAEEIEAGGVTLPACRFVAGVPEARAAALIAAGRARAAQPHEASLAGPLVLAWPDADPADGAPAPLMEDDHDA